MRRRGLAGPWPASAKPVLLASLLAWLLVVLVVGFALERERTQTLRQAQRQNETLAAVLEESTARTFEGVDIALQGIADLLAREPFPRHDPQLRTLMRARLQFLPTVRALFVIGPDGFIQHDTDFPKTPDISLADRPYFQRYLADPALQHAISEALQSRSGLGWFVASTRRITGPRGEFRGIVVAAVQLDMVSRVFRKLELGPGQVMSLLQADGRLLARFPPDDPNVGRSYAQLPVFADRLPQARAGSFLASGPPFDYARVVSYRALGNVPLVVVLSSAQSQVLASWARTASGAAAGVLVLTLVMAVALVVFVQRQQHREQVEAHRASEARAQALAQEMRDADRLKGEFLATLSHELRNVLAPMQNGMNILERVDPQSPGAERARSLVQRQLRHMRHLVDDLLDVSRVNSGKIRLAREPLDLRQLLAAAAEAAHAFMEGPGHRLDTQWPEEPLPVEVDRTRIMQVLTNLLGNAAKYTPPGGHVLLRARREGEEAVVEVVDDGLGLPPAAQDKVFEMFEQVSGHLSRAQGGLGIGLALVRKLVELHGGRVQAASAGPNLGSTFTVRLPLARPGQAAPQDATSGY